MLPKTLKIFGQKYNVKYDYESTENNGFCEADKNLISISPNLQDDKLFRVLMHEITHAIIAETPLYGRKRFNEEEICNIVGFHFIDMLKDNPILVDWLIKEIKE